MNLWLSSGVLIPGTNKKAGVAGRSKGLLYSLRVILRKLVELYIKVYIIFFKNGIPRS